MTVQKFLLSFVWLFSFLTNKKIMPLSSLGQNIFEDLEASWPRKDTFEAKDVLKDSISGR